METGRQHHRVVSHVDPFIGTDGASGAQSGWPGRRYAGMPCSSYHPLREHELSALRCARTTSDPHGHKRTRPSERNDSVLARYITLDQLFAKTLSDHPVANDDDCPLPTCSMPGFAHCAALSRLEKILSVYVKARGMPYFYESLNIFRRHYGCET